MIKAMAAPYTMVKFMPTGGINTKNLADYLSCDKILCCGGSWMVKAAERLGGADYDGDMVKTIADPILNECVRRNYEASRGSADDALSNEANIPLLMIPSATPLIRSSEDWEARFEVVRGTFSSRVGQICNAALNRSIIAYNENSDAEERKRLQDETEVLAILTGLEIDSAKSGIRPDLDEYLKKRRVRRTPFLQYKNLVEDAEETRRAWYEETHQQRIKAFFKKIDWDKVDSNLERLPYLALQLKKHTPAVRVKPARDHELFTFAQQPDWKEHLDREILEQISALLRDYEACLYGDNVFEKCGKGRDEAGDREKARNFNGKTPLFRRERLCNYQQS